MQALKQSQFMKVLNLLKKLPLKESYLIGATYLRLGCWKVLVKTKTQWPRNCIVVKTRLMEYL